MKILDKRQINAGIVCMLSNGILRMEVTKKDEITIPNVAEFINTVKKIVGGKLFCNLIIVNEYVETDIET